MPQFDISVYAAQIFWLVIFFTVLMVYTVLVAVPRMRDVLDERWQRTDGFKIAADRFYTEAKTVLAQNQKDLAVAKAEAQKITSDNLSTLAAETYQKKKEFYDGYLAQIDDAEKKLQQNLFDIAGDVEKETVEITKQVIDRVLGMDTSRGDIQKHINDNFKVGVANGN